MTVVDTAAVRVPARGQRALAWRHFRGNRAAMFGLAVVLVSLFLALFGQLISPYNPDVDTGSRLHGPSAQHWMGTDHLARDVFSRFVAGTRISLMVGLSAATLATHIGVLIGAATGYLGGWVDGVLMRAADIVLTIPGLVLGLAMAAILGASILNVILIISFLSWPHIARLVRSEFLSIREREYVRAAVAMGSSSWWIVFREILPNALPVVFVNWSYEVGRAIIVEAGLSFLGLGDVAAGSWGIMLSDAQTLLRQAWWMSVFPGLGIALSVLAANLIGEGLNDAFNPKSEGR
jgi:peptide/nickel transport system permease protein